MTEKSPVGMMLCYYCQEPKGILLERRQRSVLPYEGTYDLEPCDKCKELMEQGVLLISVRDGAQEEDDEARRLARRKWQADHSTEPFHYISNPYRTGGWCVITDDAASRMGIDLTEQRFSFIEDSAWDHLGLPRGEVSRD